MTSSLKKVFFRQIKNTKSRFISILLIVALGVGFFVGVKAASPSMKYSANKFFQSNNLMDYKIMSDYGFKNDDIKLEEDIVEILNDNSDDEVYNVMSALFEKTIPNGYIYKVSKIVKMCAELMK